MAALTAPSPAEQQQQQQPQQQQSCRGTILVTSHCPPEMRARDSWSIDQFVVAKKLGGGYASTVHLAICKASGIQVAVKVYHRCKLSQLNNYQVRREIRIHGCLDHPNVLSLFAAFEDEAGIYLVTEYASRGDVFGELDRRGGTMTEADAVRQVLHPFLGALQYLHSLSIIHRDIKPENLLFTASGGLKVADFGLSIDVTQERPVTRVGTLDYMAPEVVVCPDKCLPSDNKEKTHLHYNHLVDAWAVGVLAFELTVGRAPFDAGNKRATIEQILHASPRFPAWISEQSRHFITWALTKDVARRPGIAQLAAHPWLTSHVKAPRPVCRMPAGRAESFHDLQLFAGSGVAAAAALAGGKAGLHGPKYGAFEPVVESDCSEEDCDGGGFSSAGSGELPSPLGGGPSLVSAPGSNLSTPAAGAVPGGSPAACGGALVSPFAAASGAVAAAAGGDFRPLQEGQQEEGAQRLRAFVQRCQSVNNIDNLRAANAAAALRPPEPSHACFEPGGRMYSGNLPSPVASAAADAATQQQQAQRANGGCASPPPLPPTPPPLPPNTPHGSQQQQHLAPPPAPLVVQQQLSQSHLSSMHDSVGSVFGSSGSVGAAPGGCKVITVPPSKAGATSKPPPLQLVRMPSGGSSHRSSGSGGGMPRDDSCKALQLLGAGGGGHGSSGVFAGSGMGAPGAPPTIHVVATSCQQHLGGHGSALLLDPLCGPQPMAITPVARPPPALHPDHHHHQLVGGKPPRNSGASSGSVDSGAGHCRSSCSCSSGEGNVLRGALGRRVMCDSPSSMSPANCSSPAGSMVAPGDSSMAERFASATGSCGSGGSAAAMSCGSGSACGSSVDGCCALMPPATAAAPLLRAPMPLEPPHVAARCGGAMAPAGLRPAATKAASCSQLDLLPMVPAAPAGAAAAAAGMQRTQSDAMLATGSAAPAKQQHQQQSVLPLGIQDLRSGVSGGLARLSASLVSSGAHGLACFSFLNGSSGRQ